MLYLAIALLALTGCAGETTEAPAAKAPREAPPPLVVFGLDGATWDVMEPMIERGELPHVAKLRAEGAHGDLLVLPPLSSPVVWTSYATGHFGRVHGVLDHTFPYGPGPKRRISSTVRREPALWNLASHFGRRTAVIGYYASHPVEMIDGVMVSDRADQVDSKGAGESSGGVHPPELEEDVLAVKSRLDAPEKLDELRAAYFPRPYDPVAAGRPESPWSDVLQAARRLDRGLRHEAFVSDVALDLLERSFAEEEPFEIFIVYLRMPDITCHTTWIHFDDSTFEEKSSEASEALLGECLPEAYRQADAFLGRLLEVLDGGYGRDAYNLVMLSDHGCGPATGRHAIGRAKLQHMSGNHYPDGALLARGPDIARGEIARMDHLDVFPSLMALASLPISEELPGRIHEPLLRPGLLDERPPRFAGRYRVEWQSAGGAAPSDEAESEELAALAALGYVESGTAVGGEQPGVRFDFWQSEERLMNGALIGEAMHHLIRRRPRELRALVDEVKEQRPDFALHMPRVTRNWIELWQESFEEPLLDETMRAELDRLVEEARLEKNAVR